MSKSKPAAPAAPVDSAVADPATQPMAGQDIETDDPDGVYGDPSLPPILGGSYVVENGKRRLVDRTRDEV